jgi:hypothetical protein
MLFAARYPISIIHPNRSSISTMAMASSIDKLSRVERWLLIV